MGWWPRRPAPTIKRLDSLVVREIVETVFRNHPPECVFAPGAVDRIVADSGLAALGGKDCLIEYLERAIKAEEIYCPHEGIDRRAEFGMEIGATT